MATGRQIVKKMLQKARVITKNEEPSADEINDGLDALNNMLASWANDSLLVYYRPKEEFNLSSGVEEYTIGEGATFDTVRPVHVLDAKISLGDIDYQNLTIVNDVTYQRYVEDLNIQGVPLYLNYDNNYPIATIRVYPLPSTDYKLTLLSEKQLTAFTLDGDVDLPPGWDRALIFNGAVEIMSEYGLQLDALIKEVADKSLNAIKTGVAKNTTMDYRPMGTYGTFNIYRGW